MAHPEFGKEGGHNQPCGDETPSSRRLRRSGGVANSRQQIFTLFTLKKVVILAHFFSEKGLAVSAVTMDNAKMFSQFMSKSRSLAKMSERYGAPCVKLRNIKFCIIFLVNFG